MIPTSLRVACALAFITVCLGCDCVDNKKYATGCDTDIDATLEMFGACVRLKCDHATRNWTVSHVATDDHRVCTIDSCNTTTGEVTHTQRICNAFPGEYGDGVSACRVPVCSEDAGGCTFRLLDCDDGNPCTDDTCDIERNECTHVARECNCDELQCSECFCDVARGGCVVAPVSCDDGNICTDDYCSDGECHNVQRNCGCDGDHVFGDACTKCGCSVDGGGCWTASPSSHVCDDDDPFTEDTCNPATGCIHTPIVCSTESPCLVRHFDPVSRMCSNTTTARDCDDQNPCTDDVCDPRTGECVHTTACSAMSPNKCITNTCEISDGGECITGAHEKDCDDHNECTTDACEPSTGLCIHRQVTCAPPIDAEACVQVYCDAQQGGCVQEVLSCDDRNPCTIDTCVSGQCTNTPIDCDDGDACTMDYCRDGFCLHTHANCDDHNVCTEDSCDALSGECNHTPVTCQQATPCKEYICSVDRGGCVATDAICNDGDQCTTDRCDVSTGKCVFTRKDCDDGLWCTLDRCAPDGQCVHTPVRCDEHHQPGGSCANYMCSEEMHGACITSPITQALSCDDHDLCTTDWCDLASGQCRHSLETCGAAVAVNHTSPVSQQTPMTLPEWSYCEQRACDPRDGQCYSTPRLCDDNNACTADSCVPGVGCVHTELECEALPNKCMQSSCNPNDGICRVTHKQCSSSDPRAVCECNPSTGACECTETVCDNSDPCFVNKTSRVDGRCRARRRDCKDTNPCTADACVDGECIHYERDCSDGDDCTIDTCSQQTGKCVHTPVDCSVASYGGDRCANYECVHGVGCIAIPITGPCSLCEHCYCNQYTGEWVRSTSHISDGNACTIDICVDGSTFHMPIDCNDYNACTVDTCDQFTGQCIHTEAAVPSYLPAPPHCYEYVCSSESGTYSLAETHLADGECVYTTCNQADGSLGVSNKLDGIACGGVPGNVCSAGECLPVRLPLLTRRYKFAIYGGFVSITILIFCCMLAVYFITK